VKASSLFTVVVALLAGLAVAAIAKVSGIFNRPAPPPPPAPPEIQVLVANHNLFANFVVQATDFKTRALRPDELEHYTKHKDQYLPPVPTAAALRVLRTNLEADQPLLRQHLYELGIAAPLQQRLLPSMRAINLTLNKDEAAGGLIQAGDWVDVHLTSTIEWGGKSTTRTASIARNLRVVAKRNILWKVLLPQPDDKPVYYTLEANPYRAALIEFARDKGRLSLVPVPAAEQRRLEGQHRQALRGGNGILPVAFADADSREYRDEDNRVAAFLRSELSVGESDLVRIFNLQTGPPPLAASKPVTVQMFVGVKHDRNVIFASGGERTEISDPARPSTRSAPAAADASESGGGTSFEFSAPNSSGSGCKRCKPNRAKR
jgi:Flp pilus assembly protein CpaB